MDVNEDFLDFLGLLLEHEVEFVIVGAYAVAAHGFPRAAGRPRDLADAQQLESLRGINE